MRLARLPPLPATAHKGDRGTVVVVGGSSDMLGAPVFAAHAALRSGCGVVRMALPTALRASALALVPSAMLVDMHAGTSWPSLLEPEAVVAVGMGWSGDPAQARTFRQLLRRTHRLVIDGGALSVLARSRLRLAPGRAILTPHPGEWQRLADGYGLAGHARQERGRPAAARALALASGACVILKGHHTVVDDGRRSWRCDHGGVVLAIPGSGDTLDGVVAALWARGCSAWNAACLAVEAHARAGDASAQADGEDGLLAYELGDRLRAALRSLRSPAPILHQRARARRPGSASRAKGTRR